MEGALGRSARHREPGFGRVWGGGDARHTVRRAVSGGGAGAERRRALAARGGAGARAHRREPFERRRAGRARAREFARDNRRSRLALVKILVICAGGGIGDVLLATPVMRALRARYEEVVALTAPAHREILSRQAMLADVWVDDRSFTAQARRIGAAHFDAVVVTWATLRAAALPFAARLPIRVGQSRRLYSQLFTHRVLVRSELGDRTTHWTQILLDFARALDCDVADATPSFPIDDAERAEAERLLREHDVAEPFLLLHPTRAIASIRARWPTTGLVALARSLRPPARAGPRAGGPRAV